MIKNFLGQNFFHSFGNDTKIDFYVDKMEVSISIDKIIEIKIFD